MCRAPFDLPLYRCRLIIERVPAEGTPLITDFSTNNVTSIVEGFGLDFRTLVPPNGRFVTDVLFDIEEGEDIHEVLRELGLPAIHGSD